VRAASCAPSVHGRSGDTGDNGKASDPGKLPLSLPHKPGACQSEPDSISMSRLNKNTAILALAAAVLGILLAGAGLAFVGHLLLEGAWSGLGLHAVVFPDSR
jgi:hypothetical protein